MHDRPGTSYILRADSTSVLAGPGVTPEGRAFDECMYMIFLIARQQTVEQRASLDSVFEQFRRSGRRFSAKVLFGVASSAIWLPLFGLGLFSSHSLPPLIETQTRTRIKHFLAPVLLWPNI